jgi:hypothetical protein
MSLKEALTLVIQMLFENISQDDIEKIVHSEHENYIQSRTSKALC